MNNQPIEISVLLNVVLRRSDSDDEEGLEEGYSWCLRVDCDEALTEANAIDN
jgi:hypothetical protein